MEKQSVERALEQMDSAQITTGVRAGDSECMSALYSWVRRIVHARISGPDLGQNADDLCHEAFIIAVQAIRDMRLQDDACLIAYVRAVVRNRIAKSIGTRVRDRSGLPLDRAAQFHPARNSENPEVSAETSQRWGHMMSLLKDLSSREHEILYRFYVLQETAEDIQSALGLTPTQFRLSKSRARARIVEGMQRYENPTPVRRSMTLAMRQSRPAFFVA